MRIKCFICGSLKVRVRAGRKQWAAIATDDEKLFFPEELRHKHPMGVCWLCTRERAKECDAFRKKISTLRSRN